MFRIKVCGITSVEDALATAGAGADAIGLNFFPPSPRFVETQTARAISDATPSLLKIGVFVNAGAEAIRAAVDAAGLDAIQLHGDEAPAFLDQLAPLPIIRAFRCPAGLEAAGNYIAACHTRPRAAVVDAFTLTAYGGSGKTANWQAIAATRRSLQGIPLILAGGLNSTNLAEAIIAVQPDGVDVASGVEIEPGRKDREKIREFVRIALRELRSGEPRNP